MIFGVLKHILRDERGLSAFQNGSNKNIWN
jgi:hypothetical protein